MGQAKLRGSEEHRRAQGEAARTVHIHQRMDEALGTVQGPVACRPGCSFCCYYHIYVAPGDVFALVDFLAAQNPDLRVQVLERLRDNVARIAPLSVEQHISTNVPCALLDAHGQCAAYAARPVACRHHHSLDARMCQTAFDKPAENVSTTGSRLRNAVSSKHILAAAVHAANHGYDVRRYEMNAALFEALTDPACRDRWRRGEVTFTTVADHTGQHRQAA